MSLEQKIKESFTRHERDVGTQPGAWGEVERTIGRSHRRRIVAAGFGAALAIAGAVVLVPRLGRETPAPPASPEPTATATTPTDRGLHVVSKFAVPANALAIGDGSLWAASLSQNENTPARVLRLDPETGRTLASVTVGVRPQSIAAEDDGVWVVNASTEQPGSAPQKDGLMRIDPATNRVVHTMELQDPLEVALGFGSVWVTEAAPLGVQPNLVRIDPNTYRVSQRIALAGTMDVGGRLMVGGSYVWVPTTVRESGPEAVVLNRIDPANNKLETYTVVTGVPGPPSIAYDFGSIWISTSTVHTPAALARINPATGKLEKTIALPEAGPIGLAAIASDGTYMWAAGGRGSLWLVDPSTNQLVNEDGFLVGKSPPTGVANMVTGFGSTWVATYEGEVWRMKS